MARSGIPEASGLYDPRYEKDACGVALVADVRGRRSHEIVSDALTALIRMSHRSASGPEENTGDGAGVLLSLPHEFMRKVAGKELGIELPEPGRYGVGMIFFPRSEEDRERCREILTGYVEAQGQEILGWRRVPTVNESLGRGALAGEPVVEQLFVGAAPELGQEDFERQLYLIRKQAYHRIRGSGLDEVESYAVCSLSSRVIVYKGQLTPEQVPAYYPDLGDPELVSQMALVHARFSTNTFPSWSRAQPMRFLCHNGEINTLQGNVNWMRARQGLLRSERFGPELEKLFPIIDPETSDSGILDNVMELLVTAGRSAPEALMMMIPEAWENDETVSETRRAFYEYHASLMEPWDGPAGVLFTDGRWAGAVLDRNGLRPCRYWVTHDDRVILSSEVGVLDLEPSTVKRKGRLQPGRMFLVDMKEGRIVENDEIKERIATSRPYGEWTERRMLRLETLPSQAPVERPEADARLSAMRMFGYTDEHLRFILHPLVEKARDPTGSMGNDAALAFLSERPRLLYDYFKQLFAQVTNPPIDSTREESVMSLSIPIGPEGNLLETTEAQAERIWLEQPILSNAELAKLVGIEERGWRTAKIDMTYPRELGEDGLEETLDRICREASEAIAEGYRLIVLSDRRAGRERVPLSALLAVGAVHQHLVRTAERTKIGILLETGEPREVHHFCTLLGYGADGVNPYMAFAALRELDRRGDFQGGWSDDQLVSRYRKAVGKGMLKVMAKMGIATLASYRGAQIFEAVGLGSEVMNRCFAGTASRIGGADFRDLAKEEIRRHDLAWFDPPDVRESSLPNPGEYHWRPGGERRMWNPDTVASARIASIKGDPGSYAEFARQANDEAQSRCTIRSLFRIRESEDRAVPLEEVEPASEIVKRFTTGAMSFGALSKEAHETLAVAMNRIGAKSNSGEGGEDPERYRSLPNGDSRRSAIKQVASGRFGVSLDYLIEADQLQIKMAQGAKPGEGGELPGRKVSEDIARVRNTTPGVMLISPPPHHDIYSIEDLAQLIYDLKNANPRAAVSVKLVSAVGVGTVAAGVAKAKADHILISGHDGGTGASPLTSIKHAGLPWELGLADVHQTLVLNDLRSRVMVEVDGQLKTGRDVVLGAFLGAEEFGFSTAPLIAMGCIMMRKCHLNTCPVGVTTQDPELRARFTGEPEHVINYLFMVAEEVRGILSRVGARSVDEIIGRTDLIDVAVPPESGTLSKLDFSRILTPAKPSRPGMAVRKNEPQQHGIEDVLDRELIRRAEGVIEGRGSVVIELPVRNVDRTVGTLLSQEVVRRHGRDGLEEDSIRIRLCGSAGQSLGAWLARGVSIELEGDANDYVGKGLSGGRLVVRPSPDATFPAEENVIIGNVALYGATSGEAYFSGQAGERFCVRNSGASAVVEGVGDHGCEYMTGGRAVILGPTGRNFAAGMSGGFAYVWDPSGAFPGRCNQELVQLERFRSDLQEAESEEEKIVRSLIERHYRYTGSKRAGAILKDWDSRVMEFVRVVPTEYQRVLDARKAAESERRRTQPAARPSARRLPVA